MRISAGRTLLRADRTREQRLWRPSLAVRAALQALALLVSAGAASAGTLVVNVRDVGGGAIAGAEGRVTTGALATVATAVTNEVGTFTLAGVPAGRSVLTVQACYVAEELYGGSCNGLTHGGEIEALAVLANRPELVHLDRIENSSDHSHGHRMDKLRRTRSYQPVLTDIRSIAPTGWFGAPQHANAEKGHRMVGDIADAIAREAAAIFRQLDAVQGGSAELKQLRQVG